MSVQSCQSSQNDQACWLERLHRADVARCVRMQGSAINLAGMGATLLGLQATVGLLVAKTLTNATANPFLSGGQGSYNPVLALDVFLVQVLPGQVPLLKRQLQSCTGSQPCCTC